MNPKSTLTATPLEQEQLLEIARVVLAMLGEKVKETIKYVAHLF